MDDGLDREGGAGRCERDLTGACTFLFPVNIRGTGYRLLELGRRGGDPTLYCYNKGINVVK